MPLSATRSITVHHAKQITELGESLELPTTSTADVVIGESDGSMIPIVETYLPEESDKIRDRRKHKRLFWKEARLSMAHARGSVSPLFWEP